MELASFETGSSYSTIYRLDQVHSVAKTADVDEETANAFTITSDLYETLVPKLVKSFPALRVLSECQQEQTKESMNSKLHGFIGVMIAMYFLLAIEFRCYFQPLLVWHRDHRFDLTDRRHQSQNRVRRSVVRVLAGRWQATLSRGIADKCHYHWRHDADIAREFSLGSSADAYATSLSLGLVFATVLVLIPAPGFYVLLFQATQALLLTVVPWADPGCCSR